MTTQAIHGFAGVFAREDSAGAGTYTDVAEVMSITPPQYARETNDATSRDSTGRYREFLGGLRDAGEVSIELNYDPTVHTDFMTDFDSDDSYNYKITWPGSETVTFAAFITAIPPAIPMEDKVTATLTFKVTGKPTWA